MDCCGYLRFAGPTARNLLKRMGCAAAECYIRSTRRIRRKLAPKYACPCDLLSAMSVYGQSGASSTPPPLPYRHGSSASLNSDRSESTSSVGKVPFPPLPDPPQPPKNRLVKNYPVSTPSSVAQRTSSPARPTARKEDLTPTKPWYFDVGRRDAERALKQCIEGAFLVRPTQHGEKGHRYTMSIIFNRRVFHIPVRQKSDGRWALGSEKPDEETFQSVEELVDEHRMKPINLHTDHRLVGTTCLMIWPSGQSF